MVLKRDVTLLLSHYACVNIHPRDHKNVLWNFDLGIRLACPCLISVNVPRDVGWIYKRIALYWPYNYALSEEQFGVQHLTIV